MLILVFLNTITTLIEIYLDSDTDLDIYFYWYFK